MKSSILFTCIVLIMVVAGAAQSGGTFEIKQSVTANSGGTSSGGTFSVDGTAGQPLIDISNQAPFSVESGFWSSSFTPTAAGVSVSGRVRTADGRGLSNAIVTLVACGGLMRSTRTGSFGYYRFDDLAAGETVVVSISSKRYIFQPLVLTLNDHITDADFSPDGGKEFAFEPTGIK